MSKLGIFGPQGSGKSLFAMILVRSLQKQYPDLKVYTNINAVGKNLVVIDDLGDIPFQDGKPKVFVIDEAYFTLDSRGSSSKQNRIWSRAFALFRKSDIVLTVFITHRPRMLDVNIREQLDFVLMCRKEKEMFSYLLVDSLSMETSPIQMPKHPIVYDFADYDTKDFPLAIWTEKLQENPIFQLIK